jgi:hydroxymethylbilane synthase
MRSKLVVGTRGSRLASLQTETVAGLLQKANPGLEIEIKKVATAGDRDRQSPIEQMGTDVFVKELEEELLRGGIDIAVHSCKDMPTELPEGLGILAIPARENPADVLISRRGGLDELPAGSRIGTGSLRRTAQLAACRPDLQSKAIRGNIETRLRKAAAGDFDGIILAAAALLRLGWQERVTEHLPLEAFLPAAGQGALAIEGRLDDPELAALVAPVNQPDAWRCVTAERAFLRALGGGCRAPIGVLGTINGDKLRLEAMITSPDGREVKRTSVEDDAMSPPELGIELARQLLDMGAGELLPEVRQ